MEQKIIYRLLILLFLTFFVAKVGAQILDPETLQNDSIVRGVEQLRNFTEENKWDYLGQEWKSLLLKSKYIAAVDKTFRNVNFIFFILFAQNYDLSLILLFVIMWWIFFFVIFSKTIADFSTLGKWVSYIVAFVLTIFLAHFKFLNNFSLIIFKLIFFKNGIWGWTALFIFILLYLAILVYFERLIYVIGGKMKKTKEEIEKWDEKFQRQVFRKKVEGVEKAFSEVEDAISP